MRFTIITPSYNSERFIRETIESVINQKGDFSIEYIIVDSCSTDDTRAIVDEYLDLLKSWKMTIKCNDVQIEFISEKDSGMYEAIQKGFDRATGDIFAWINSDDIYLDGAFDHVSKVFSQYPEVDWLKGVTSYIDEDSKLTFWGLCYLYQQEWIEKGLYGPVLYFIQQDSVFWRSSLWELGYGKIFKYSLAGDYYLWRQFAKNKPLYSLNIPLSCFRKVSGQKSESIQSYWQELEQKKMIDRRLVTKMRVYFRFESKLSSSLASFLRKLIFGKQMYYLILMGKDGKYKLCEGDYYSLKKYL